MNPTQSGSGIGSYNNPFESIEARNEYEQAEPASEVVSHKKEHLDEIRSGWESFYRMKSVDRTEGKQESSWRVETFSETRIEAASTSDPFTPDLKPIFAIEDQKGNGSLFEETGIDINPLKKVKGLFSGLFGALGLFKEIFSDTVTLVVGKKEKKAAKVPSDPEKAKAEAEKKAKEQKKKNNIRAFYDGLRAQASTVATVEVVQAETQEKANINKTSKIGHESYKGVKNSFGRLTVYAASMFEREQLDMEKKAKKAEKEQKIAAMSGKRGPDLGLDKVAEGGFLSSTGGQGAG
jgi:hypothetical protein